MSLLTLQQYWWMIISLLGAVLVFLMFVQGGQTMIYSLGKTENERKVIVNALGRKWEFTFTTLVTFGGAFFASFPLFYSTSFGGAYWVWMLILFCFIIQAIAYEFRTKPNNFLGKRTYETFLFINGLFGTILIGTAVATFFTGSEFTINDMNQSRWEAPYRGLELALDFSRYATYINLSLGLAVFFLARTLANLYFINNIDQANIVDRARKQILKNGIPFVFFFLFFLVNLLLMKGFAYNPETKIVSMESYKYLHNLWQMPVVLILFFIGVAIVLIAIYRSYFHFETCQNRAIWPASIGTILVVFCLFLVAGFNNTCFYPSTFDLQSSLSIENSSSSKYTLTAMSYVSLMVPFVIAYIWWAWKSMNKTKISEEEVNEDHHSY